MNGTIAVVGGGIAGVTVAFELARRGTAVTLFEQANLAAGASGRNTGTLLHQTEPAVAAMLRVSEAAYRELAGGPVDFRLTAREQLLLVRDEDAWEPTTRRVRAIEEQSVEPRQGTRGEGADDETNVAEPRVPSEADRAEPRVQSEADGVEPCVRAERLTGAELRAALPVLDLRAAGGYALPGAYTVDSEAATRAFAEAARKAGATIRTGVRVGAVRAGGLITDAGPFAADAVVIATGPWLTDLLPHAPLRAGRGWLMRTSRLPFALPWILEEDSWPDQVVLGRAAEPALLADLAAGAHDRPVAQTFLLCPLPSGDALLGASLSTSLRDAVEGGDAPAALAARALELAPGLARTIGITRAWSGLRPMTPDGLPLVGPTDVEGVYVHGGHASLGMQAAPATARWLAAHMHGEETDPTLEDLWPSRFPSATASAA